MLWLHLILALSCVCHGAAEESGTDSGGLYTDSSDVWKDDRTSEEPLRRLVTSLLERLERQETRLRQLERTVSDNVEDLKRKDIRIGHLERDLSDMKMAPNPIYRLVDKHQSSVSGHNSNPDLPRVKPRSDKDANTSEQASEGNSENEMSSKSIRVSPVDSSGANAFSTSLSGDLTLHPGLVIVFNEVLLDVDGSYNKGDGVYEVPVSGVYVFTWVTTGVTSDVVVTELVVNGSPRGSTITNTEPRHAWDSSTGVIVTSVSVGDHVAIRSQGVGSLHSSPHYGMSIFSGWRLV